MKTKKALVVAMSFMILAAGSVANACNNMAATDRNAGPKLVASTTAPAANIPAPVKTTTSIGADGQQIVN